jgi:hypothetical protein
MYARRNPGASAGPAGSFGQALNDQEGACRASSQTANCALKRCHTSISKKKTPRGHSRGSWTTALRGWGTGAVAACQPKRGQPSSVPPVWMTSRPKSRAFHSRWHRSDAIHLRRYLSFEARMHTARSFDIRKSVRRPVRLTCRSVVQSGNLDSARPSENPDHNSHREAKQSRLQQTNLGHHRLPRR